MPKVFSSYTIQVDKGFTLIELLIAVSLIAILAGISIPSFTSYFENQNRRQALEKLKSDLRTAQNNAMTGADSTSVDYWGIQFTDDANSYSLFKSSTNTDCGVIQVVEVSMGALPADVRTRFISSGQRCIYFKEAVGDATSDAGTLPIVIGYIGDSGTQCLGVNVSAVGLITSSTGNSCP